MMGTRCKQNDVMKTLTSRSIIQLRRCSDALHGFRFTQEFLLYHDHER